MATPLSASAFLKALRDEGLDVVLVGDWDDHNRNHKGPWGPVHGVLLHHTVTKGSARTVEICRKGYEGLPGPLCHGVITKDGKVHLVGYGRANHAGTGDDDVLRAVINETSLPADNETTTDGNRHFYGFECENLGDGDDPWPAAQVEAMVRASAAVLRAHGWNKNGQGGISVIAHAEWQPGKVDPRGPGYPGHAGIRARVAERLKHPASWSAGSSTPSRPPVQEEDPMAGMTKRDVFEAVWMTDALAAPDDAADRKTNPNWWAGSTLRDIQAKVRSTDKRVAAMSAAITALAGQVGSGADTATVVAAVERAIADAVVKVSVEVTDETQEV
ncbi:N-acetylmuramoyl-L-alanine amidase [Streptomyces sp. NPDC057336]|uniref:N-acetylmuramoyl-L-alanine amidase n=1 Tax=Streptomyces sp. NPDC057336 TaxID=3346102 RepID=UPI003635F5A6